MLPLSQEARELRQELKAWERAFADANGGRKPTREEIKKDKAIAAKYTEYYKSQPSSKTPKAKSSEPTTDSKPRNSHARESKPYNSKHTTTPTAISHDPTNPFAPSLPSSSVKSTTTIPSRPTTSTSVSTSIFRTPSKPSHHLKDLYDSPLSSRGRRLFGNRPRDSVGPTPQKTGKVLGIFESFSEDIDVESTPSHKRTIPSKVAASPAFSTPRKRKVGELGARTGTGTPRTPGTSRTVKDVFSTPAFLRRSFIGSLEESPPVSGPRRRPLVKGLSTMVAELRKLEDQAHNEVFGDDEEAMREMEVGYEPAAKKPKEIEEVVDETIILEHDPDTGLPPLPEGAWREEEIVEEEESGDEKEDKARKWKKKGLKRQHRRVIMRPVGKTTTTTAGSEDDAPPPPNPEEIELPGAGYSDEDLSDLDNLPDEPQKKPAAVVEKKSTRKVSEKAHANYRRLNIRGSKGAKAANNRTGRFARKKR